MTGHGEKMAIRNWVKRVRDLNVNGKVLRDQRILGSK